MKLEKMLECLVKNRKITLFFVLLAVVAGVLAFVGMPKQETPDITSPYAMITTVYPGASANDVDSYVTEPIINSVKALKGYKTVTSFSYNNLSMILLEFEFSTDREEAFRTLRSALSELQGDLPESCGQIDVNTDITDTAGVLISLSSAELSNAEVVVQAKRIRDSLQEIDGFQRFEIIGNLNREITVTMNQTRMQSAGLTLSQAVSLIGAANTDLPLGTFAQNGQRTTVDYVGGFQNVDDVAAMGIGYSAQLGRVIQLKDIASVTEAPAARNTYYTHNGDQAVILAGYFKSDINVLPLKNEIQKTLDTLEGEQPEVLDVSLIMSQPQEINDSLIDFMRNLLVSVGLVILVVLVGMGIKNAVVVSVSLPLSVLLSFIAMNVLGIKIQQISIAALVLSLGMLVDNSIIVSDSIQFQLDAGENRLTACTRGVRSVALPVLTSTLTTIAAFAPFLFLHSLAGDYIHSLPQIVIIALTASYLSAVLVIPVLGFIFFRARKQKAGKKNRRAMQNLLEGSLRHRWAVVAVVLVLLAGSAYLAINLDTIFFPASEKNILYIDIRNNMAGDAESTREIVNSLSDAIATEPGITEMTAAAGGALPRFNDIMYIYTQTPDSGQMLLRVDLKLAGFKTNEEYLAYLQHKLDGLGLAAKITVKELMYAFPTNEDLRVKIIGKDIDTLKDYEGLVFGTLADMDGLMNEGKGNSDYQTIDILTMDSAAALAKGIISAEALNEISIAMLGREAVSLMDGVYRVPVVVTAGANTPDAVNDIVLKTLSGEYISAGDIISLSQEQVLTNIPRVDGDYAMVVTADYDPAFDKQETLSSLKTQLEALNLTDAQIVYDGEDVKIAENFGQVGVFGIFALAAVFVILLLQFKSFRMPVIIFITIPLSLIGSALGLYVTGLPLSFTALLGVVSLFGIVVNNAIILVDFINQELLRGIELRDACVHASMRRLRPIVLSSVTTVIGLIPLALSASQLFKPMAVALMSGLLVSAFLTLVVLPVFVSFSKRKARN